MSMPYAFQATIGCLVKPYLVKASWSDAPSL